MADIAKQASQDNSCESGSSGKLRDSTDEILSDPTNIGAGFDSDLSEERIGPMSVMFMKEKARVLASRSKFYEATSLLEEMDEDDEIEDVGTRLLMAECYLQLGRENRANKCIKFVKKFLTSNPLPDAHELIDLALEFIATSSYVRALLILKIAASIILDSAGKPDEILYGVFKCYSKTDNIVTAMLKGGGRNRTIAADLGMESMLEMYDDIRGIKGCARDDQVLKEAWCCRYLDFNFHLMNDQKKTLEYGRHGIENLERHFTEEGAQRYHIYGVLLHNLGVTLCNTQKFDQALATHKKALEAKENALDYGNEARRISDIEETKKGLKLVRIAMGNM